jgi:hypothetical protein
MESLKAVTVLMLIMPSWVYGGVSKNHNIVSVCYNYNCASESQVELSGPEWIEILKLFSRKARSPHDERKMISKAIALMEELTGGHLGTSNDKGRNRGAGEPGQMDCIDESRNTTSYLTLFKKRGWIRWHQIEDRAVRSPFFFDTHWTAVIRDNKSNQRYAVDSWYRDNGSEPVISTLEEWMAN